MSSAADMWRIDEPPKDGKYYLCWCAFNYGGGQEIVRRPVVLRWLRRDEEISGGEWEWDDSEARFWGTIEFYANIEEPG